MTNNVSTDLVSVTMSHVVTPDTIPLRSVVFNLPDYKIDAIGTALETNNFNEKTLANTFGSVGQSSINPTRVATIVGNGGGKYSYVAKFHTLRGDNTLVASTVFGYTSGEEVSVINEQAANISPNLVFVINSIVEETYFTVNNEQRLISTATYNVVRNYGGTTRVETVDTQTYLLRPEDVVTNMQIGKANYNSGQAGMGALDNPANILDISAEGIDKGHENINTHFVNTMVTLTNETNKHAYSSGVSDALIDAKCTLLSPNVYSNPFIEILTALDNDVLRGDTFLRTEFTILDLLKIEGVAGNVYSTPSLNGKLSISGPKEILVNGVPLNSLAPLQMSMVELSIGYDIVAALSSLMANFKLTELKFVMTNDMAQRGRDLGLAHNVGVLNMFGTSILDNPDLAQVMNVIELEIKNVLFPQVCPPGHKLVVTVDALYYGYVGLSIKLENQPIVNMGLPVFLDSALTKNVGDMTQMNDMFGSYMKIDERLK